ncbi:MAG: 3-carboxyethylcatechol 2,3-dioxygenase [Betaproteobacteria bacterium]
MKQLQLACASHTPLMAFTEPAGGREEVSAALRRLGRGIEAFDPQLVFQFSPDHYNGFFYDLMPPFCLGVQASAIGDWGTHSGPLEVPADIALGAHRAVIEAGIDLALSYRMVVDHGFTQFWQITVGSAERYPIVPIFINCAAAPLPPFARVRALGEAIGRYAAGLGKRVLFVGSGGLSHDPPLPQIATADAQRREFLIAGRNPGPEARAARQERILAAGKASAKGEGPCRPLNPEWDKKVLHLLEENNVKAFDAFTGDEVRRLGGSGGAEIRAWQAAFAALASAGKYEAKIELYRPIPEWIVGMGVMHAHLT